MGVKNRKFCWYVKFSCTKGEFWIQEVIRAHLDTCLRLSSIDEIYKFHATILVGFSRFTASLFIIKRQPAN